MAFYPAVIAANTNLQYLTSQAYWNPFQFNVIKGLLNKGVPQSPFFEKYVASFFNSKISVRAFWSSARKRAVSACSGDTESCLSAAV